jgi:YggT family protein
MDILLIRSFSVFFQLINFLLVVRVLLSWVKYNPENRYIILLFNLTDPILDPFKKLLKRLNVNLEMVDLSPLVAMLAIQYIIQPLVNSLIRLFL